MRCNVPNTFHHALSILAWIFLTSPAQALEQDKDETIHLNARTIEANEKTGVTVYRGNVSFEQGGLSIHAERVEIHAPQHEAELIVATGKPVKLRQRREGQADEFLAEADRLEFRVGQQELTMRGNVKLRRGKDIFTSATLHYDLSKNTLNAEGGDGDGRVTAIIQPKLAAPAEAQKP